MSILKSLLPATLLLTVSIANADEELKYGVQASFGFGGDTIITTETTETTIDAGDNYRFGGYLLKPELIYGLSTKLALNYISVDKEYTNATEDLNSISIDFLLMKEIISGVYLGAGVTSHLTPSYELLLDGGDSEKIDYDPALGLVIEVTKTFRNGLEVGFSYTSIEYSGTEDTNNANNFDIANTVDASSFALTTGFSF